MDEVSFSEEPEIVIRKTPHTKKDFILTRLLISTGIVKDPAQANVIFIVIAIICLGIAGFLMFNTNNTYPPASKHPIPPGQNH